MDSIRVSYRQSIAGRSIIIIYENNRVKVVVMTSSLLFYDYALQQYSSGCVVAALCTPAYVWLKLLEAASELSHGCINQRASTTKQKSHSARLALQSVLMVVSHLGQTAIIGHHCYISSSSSPPPAACFAQFLLHQYSTRQQNIVGVLCQAEPLAGWKLKNNLQRITV